jgi:hypothetical protein
MNGKSFLFATLIAGVVMGLLGNLPFINLCNCLLCIWVWLSGALSVVLYRRFQHGAPGPSVGLGAGLGAVAGLIGAFVGFFVFLLTSAISVPIMEQVFRSLDVETAGGFEGFGSGIFAALIWLAIDLVLYPLFGALSGLITASVGASSATPPTASATPPTPGAPPPAASAAPPGESPTPPAAT